MKTRSCTALCVGLVALLVATNAMSLNILDAEYDGAGDEVIFTVAYRGTHPHSFGVTWLECRQMSDGSQEILGIVRPNDRDDPAKKDFKTKVRINMSGFPCRPATVFIGGPYRKFRRAVEVPAGR